MAFVEFKNLHTWFYTDSGVVKAVNGVDFEIQEGETVCVVGESGCRKSVTALSMMHLVHSSRQNCGRRDPHGWRGFAQNG